MEAIIFNVCQALVLVSHMAGGALITSTSAKTRLWAFYLFLGALAPDMYLCIVAELWWFLAMIPYWTFINARGVRNNLKEIRNAAT